MYQQLLLLLLKDSKGTIFSGVFYHQALSGAFIADLLLLQHIEIITKGKKKYINLINPSPPGDELLDECIERLKNARRRGTVQTWVSRFSSIKQLRHRAAAGLCRNGVLQMKEDSVLLLFKRKVYPEINPVPEKEIIARLEQAIFTDTEELSAETVILLALCDSAGILRKIFDKKALKSRKQRIKRIVNGEVIGRATREVIDSVQAAVMVAAIMPAIIASTTVNTS
jgi:hypothetical protein